MKQIGFLLLVLLLFGSCTRNCSTTADEGFIFSIGWENDQGHQMYSYGDSLEIKCMRYPWGTDIYRVTVFDRGVKKADVIRPNTYYQIRDEFLHE
jgi:hypothetical protein